MKKITIRLLALCIAALLALPLSPVGLVATAEEGDEALEERYFARLEEGQEFLVNVEWETSRPVIRFRSPSGRIYDTAVETEDTRLSVGDTMLYYYIPDAEAGDWYVLYDKLDNDTVTVALEQTSAPFVVENVTAADNGNGTATVSFSVAYDQVRTYNYRISVSATDDSAGRQVATGMATVGEETTVNVDLSAVSSYGEYRVYVYAWFDRDGVDIFHGAYSDPFAYDNPYMTDATTQVTLTVRPELYLAELTWTTQYNYTYLVSLFEDGGEEPVAYEEIAARDGDTYTFSYGVDAQTVEVRIAEKYGDRQYSREKVLSFRPADLPRVEFEEAELTNRRYVALDYAGFKPDLPVTVTVNDASEELALTGGGSLEVGIDQSVNEISVRCAVSDEIAVVYDKEMYLDDDPPRIYMLQDYTQVRTQADRYDLAGTVTGANELFVGGVPVPLEEGGNFLTTVSLAQGENVITAEAVDGAGNRTVYTAVIYRDGPGAGNAGEAQGPDAAPEQTPGKTILSFLPLMVTGVALVAAVVTVLLLERRKKKATAFAIAETVMVFLTVAAAAATGWCGYHWLTAWQFNNSPAFIETAYQAVEQAETFLQQEAMWQQYTVISAIVAAVCLAAAVAVPAIRKAVKRAGEKKQGG